MISPIEQFITEYHEIYSFLMSNGKVSEAVTLNEHYRKILLLSFASFYEKVITQLIQLYIQSKTDDKKIYEFLNNKAIQRQYHTYFDWKQTNNINNFLGMFGSDFKKEISDEIKKSEELQMQTTAFLTIGAERNKMVHENFLEYHLDKTFDEIVDLHQHSLCFIEYLNSIFVNSPHK